MKLSLIITMKENDKEKKYAKCTKKLLVLIISEFDAELVVN